MSNNHIVWDIVRKNSSFKRSSNVGNKPVFSSEPLNVSSEFSYKASGFAQTKAVSIVPVTRAGKKGPTTRLAVVSKVVGKANKPSKAVTHSFIGSNLKKVAKTIATVTEGNNSYRPDSKAALLARFSLLRKSNKKVKA